MKPRRSHQTTKCNFRREEEKTARNFGPPPFWTPTFLGPTLLGHSTIWPSTFIGAPSGLFAAFFAAELRPPTVEKPTLAACDFPNFQEQFHMLLLLFVLRFLLFVQLLLFFVLLLLPLLRFAAAFAAAFAVLLDALLLLLLRVLSGRLPLKNQSLPAFDLLKCLYCASCCLCCCHCCFLLCCCCWCYLCLRFMQLAAVCAACCCCCFSCCSAAFFVALLLLLLLLRLLLGRRPLKNPPLPLLTFPNVKNKFTIDETTIDFAKSQQPSATKINGVSKKKKASKTPPEHEKTPV